MKRPTVTDIAQRAGVSRGAVSYALNGRPGVSAATRDRVQEIARQLGWTPAPPRPDRLAGAFGMVLGRPADALVKEPFFMALLAGIQREIGSGRSSLLFQSVPDRETELHVYRRWHGERRVDGVLIADLRVRDTRVSEVVRIGLPAVVLGGPLGHPDVPSVWIDDAPAIGKVLGHLAALGHERVTRIAGPAEFALTRVRSAAFAAAAAKAGFGEVPTVHTDYSGRRVYETVEQVLSTGHRPTALVFDNDVMAVAGLAMARRIGLAVPADLSLVAGEDSPLCRLTRPALAAVRRPVVESGALAVSVLRRVLAGERGGDVSTSAPRLVLRASTGPPRV